MDSTHVLWISSFLVNKMLKTCDPHKVWYLLNEPSCSWYSVNLVVKKVRTYYTTTTPTATEVRVWPNREISCVYQISENQLLGNGFMRAFFNSSIAVP